MDLKPGAYLIAPSIKNVSCTHARYTQPLYYYIGPFDVIQALIILMLTIGIIGANLILIFVINHRRYSPYIHPQPRYLLTSLALNDFAIGILITPLGLLPALFHCWPYGEIFCQIQALLRGALCQQSAVILICMAVDRYICALHPEKYQQHSSKKGCVAVLSIAWTLCLTVFGFLVLPKGYYFNETGLLVCEPFYGKPSYRILATCSLYFPTTMILMYCYGSSFHASRFRLVVATPSALLHQHSLQMSQTTPTATTTITGPTTVTGTTTLPSISEKRIFSQEKRLTGSVTRTMAAMSLGFIVMVTPWTIQEVVAACTGSKVPPFLDFLVTWTAISNSFWNPFLYWLLNAHFRRISKEILVKRCCFREETTSEHKLRCCSVSSECDVNGLPMPPGPPTSRPPETMIQHHTDYDTLSEKYWGEILERTVSSSSLQTLQQRAYSTTTDQQQKPSMADNGQQHQLHCLKSSVIDLNYRHHHPTHLQQHQFQQQQQQQQQQFLQKHQQEQSSTPQPNSNQIPSAKQLLFNQSYSMHSNNTNNIESPTNLANFSNSEPHLCDLFIHHDVNCAKNKTSFLNDRHHSIKGLPNI